MSSAKCCSFRLGLNVLSGELGDEQWTSDFLNQFHDTDSSMCLTTSMYQIYIDADEKWYFDGSVQDCSISSALAMEILQSCTEPSTWNQSITEQDKIL